MGHFSPLAAENAARGQPVDLRSSLRTCFHPRLATGREAEVSTLVATLFHQSDVKSLLTFKTDVGTRFEKQLREWKVVAGVSFCDALRQQGKLLIERIIQGPKGASGSYGIATPPNSLAQGMAAVRRDIYHAVYPVQAKGFQNPQIRRRVSKAERSGDLKALEAMARNGAFGPGLRGAVFAKFRPDMHTEQRDRRGRVLARKVWKYATTDTEWLRAYVKAVQQHVGQAKAGWVRALKALGGKPRDWYDKPGSYSSGEVEDKLKPGNPKPTFTATNRSAWASIGDEDRIVAHAMAYREKMMAADIERRLREDFRKGNML